MPLFVTQSPSSRPVTQRDLLIAVVFPFPFALPTHACPVGLPGGAGPRSGFPAPRSPGRSAAGRAAGPAAGGAAGGGAAAGVC